MSALTLEQGDALVLCTDGLTKHVTEKQISDVLRKASNAETGCRELVDLALAGGGRDNVTVIVAAYKLPEDPARTKVLKGDEADAQTGR